MTRNRYRHRAARQHAQTVRNAIAAGTLCGPGTQGMTASRWRQYAPREMPRARYSNATASVIAPIRATARRRPWSPRPHRTTERPLQGPLADEPSRLIDDLDSDRPTEDQYSADDESALAWYEPDRRMYGLDFPGVPAQGDRPQQVFRPDSSQPRVLWPPISDSIPAGWDDDDELEEGEILDTPIPIRAPLCRLPIRLRRRSPEIEDLEEGEILDTPTTTWAPLRRLPIRSRRRSPEIEDLEEGETLETPTPVQAPLRRLPIRSKRWSPEIDDLEDVRIFDTSTPSRAPLRRLPVRSRRRSPEEQMRSLRQAIDEMEWSHCGESEPEDTGDER